MVYFVHGHSRSNIYRRWVLMISRCENMNDISYRYYGGRGIKVCSRWRLSFKSFLDDMGYPPSKFTLDRIDASKGYSKSNCRWASKRLQAQNRSSNKMLTISGTTLCLEEWSRKSGVPATTISERLGRGWPIHDAIYKTPLNKKSRNAEMHKAFLLMQNEVHKKAAARQAGINYWTLCKLLRKAGLTDKKYLK